MIVFIAIEQPRLQPASPSLVISNAEYRRTASPQANWTDTRSNDERGGNNGMLGVANFAFPGIMGRTKIEQGKQK